jgi:hypothetical protein
MEFIHSRRHFLASASLVATSSFFVPRESLATEGPPETTAIRLKKQTAICFAPLYVVEAFLGAEGFSDVQYVTAAPGRADVDMIERGDLDFDITFAGAIVHELDSGLPLTALGGLHVGCYELFAREPIRSISDLKGRRVAKMATKTVATRRSIRPLIRLEEGAGSKKGIVWTRRTGRNQLEDAMPKSDAKGTPAPIDDLEPLLSAWRVEQSQPAGRQSSPVRFVSHGANALAHGSSTLSSISCSIHTEPGDVRRALGEGSAKPIAADGLAEHPIAQESALV